MPVKDIFTFNEYSCIPVFCYNKDLKRIALSPNNNEVHIYSRSGSQWKLDSILTEHSERVTGIDWAPNSNKILSCAADRNAYVWTEEKPNEWKQSLVLLRVDRAAIYCKWAPCEVKFAVGTGSRLISVCYFEESNDWWVSKHIKKPIRSSVLCVDWHPNSSVLAAGSSDFRVRVFSAGVKEIEKKPDPTTWGTKLAFGALLAEFSTTFCGWVHSLSFSPNGDKLVWVGHDSTVNIADTSAGGETPITYFLKIQILPLQVCMFLTETTIIAGGHNNTLYKFEWNGSDIKNCGDIDIGGNKKSEKDTPISAMSKFRNLDKLAQSSSIESLAEKKTHSNTITHIVRMPNNEIATSGLDSKIATWEIT